MVRGDTNHGDLCLLQKRSLEDDNRSYIVEVKSAKRAAESPLSFLGEGPGVRSLNRKNAII